MDKAICDFFINFAGSNSGNRVVFSLDNVPDFAGYYQTVRTKSANRVLAAAISAPTMIDNQSPVEAIRDVCISNIETFAAVNQADVGNFAIIGSSNGAGVALSVACKLQDKFKGSLSYVRLLDLPMFPDGRRPEIQNVGNMQPFNEPDVSAGRNVKQILMGGLLMSRIPNVGMLDPSAGDVPILRIQTAIQARVKVNTYQTQGNHIKLSATSVYRWKWTSNMAANEVHGKIEGDWRNDPQDASSAAQGPNTLGRWDDFYHSFVCKNANYFREAGDELGRSVP